MASANVVGSMFKAYPASGSLSRTAVVQSVGAKTRMHLIPAVLVVMLVLVAITPLLYTLPKAILGSVVRAGAFVVRCDEALCRACKASDFGGATHHVRWEHVRSAATRRLLPYPTLPTLPPTRMSQEPQYGFPLSP